MWLGCGGCVNPSGLIALPYIQRQWPFTSHHFFAVPHCYPLHKEAALFVHGCKWQTCLKMFICISECTQHVLVQTPYATDVYPGPPADLGNKVFQRANIWLEVASDWCWIRSMSWVVVLNYGFVSWNSLWQILLVQIMPENVFPTIFFANKDRTHLDPNMYYYILLFFTCFKVKYVNDMQKRSRTRPLYHFHFSLAFLFLN